MLSVDGTNQRTEEDFHLYDKPVFVFTIDVDWGSEDCISILLDTVRENQIVPTVFATHDSPLLRGAQASGEIMIGLHPNFLPGSTHGVTREEVIQHMFEIYPDARCFRSHAMVDDSHISMAMKKRDVLYDSNLCLYLQANLVPLHQWTGIPRFPLFWSDDIHWRRNGSWVFNDYKDIFFTPGLKVINTHPFMFALNLADHETYTSLKAGVPTFCEEQIEIYRNPGKGTASFILDFIKAVQDSGYGFTTFDELYDAYPKETIY